MNSAIRCCGRSSTCRWSRSPSNGRNSRSPGRARATAAAGSSMPSSTSPTRPFPISPRASHASAASRRGFPASRSRASSPTSSPCRRAMAMRSCARIMAAGEPFGIAPYGTEALGVMRIEKGHVAGNELNGQTTARDLGLGRMMSTKKDFIGRVLAGRAGAGRRRTARACRLQAGRAAQRGCAPARISSPSAPAPWRRTTRAT